MTNSTIRRSIVLVIVAALASGGCFTTARQRNTAIVTGALAIAAGVALAQATDADRDRDLIEELDCLVLCRLGDAIVAGGAAMMIAGVAAHGAVAVSDRFADPEPQPTPTVAELRVPVSVQRPLPQVSTDDTTLRLAKQARATAMAGNCQATHRALAEIEDRDARYRAALVASNVIDGCR